MRSLELSVFDSGSDSVARAASAHLGCLIQILWRVLVPTRAVSLGLLNHSTSESSRHRAASPSKVFLVCHRLKMVRVNATSMWARRSASAISARVVAFVANFHSLWNWTLVRSVRKYVSQSECLSHVFLDPKSAVSVLRHLASPEPTARVWFWRHVAQKSIDKRWYALCSHPRNLFRSWLGLRDAEPIVAARSHFTPSGVVSL